MNCPQCNEEIKPLEALNCKANASLVCEVCNAQLGTNRALSKAYLFVLCCSGLIFIVPLVALGTSLFFGGVTISALIAIYFLLCFVEMKVFGLKISDKSEIKTSTHDKGLYQHTVNIKT